MWLVLGKNTPNRGSQIDMMRAVGLSVPTKHPASIEESHTAPDIIDFFYPSSVGKLVFSIDVAAADSATLALIKITRCAVTV
ncbi:MAG: hypothetical protein VB142_09320 [Burkholderia sp.]